TEPRQPLLGKGLAGRREARRVVEDADMKMDLARPARALETERRAAARAETTAHAGRGFEDRRLALGKAHIRLLDAGIGRDWRTGMAPAARAMAEARPFRRAFCGETDRAAETASFTHACPPVRLLESRWNLSGRVGRDRRRNRRRAARRRSPSRPAGR